MLVYLLLLLATVAAQTQTTIDPSVLIDVFGPPPTETSVTTSPKLEDITVKPTDKNEFVDKNGENCKCVPYYLCNTELKGVDANNATVTGWGELDIRFGEDECQESVEKCCTSPKDPSDVDIHKPDPTRLRGCGYRNPKGVDFTIKGGSGAESEFGEFPWVVALLDNRNQSYAGVGVIIHPQVIMTGAHIATKYPDKDTLKVRAGEWDTQTNKERLPFQESVVKEIYIHSDYHAKSLRNDVALLRLEQPLELAEHINVVCMPRQGESFDGNRGCVANGWGKDHFGMKGRYAVILKKVEVDMVQHERCNQQLKKTRLGSKFKLHSSFVCAGGEEGKDTCQGDGGAPLACPVGEDRYKLSGLVAWGIGCGVKDVPAVYVNVAAFRQWVDDKMAEWGYDTSGYTGDGGAPLACPVGEDRYKLSGLVAWGTGCGVKDVPAVYVNVAAFRQWVDDKMAEWGYDTSGYTVHRYKLSGLVAWGCGVKDVPAVYVNVAAFRQWVDDKMAEWGYDTSGYTV